MKVYCDECYGTGFRQVKQSSENFPYDAPCELCNGNGYTEQSVINSDEIKVWAHNAKRLDDYWTRNDVVDYESLIDKLDELTR